MKTKFSRQDLNKISRKIQATCWNIDRRLCHRSFRRFVCRWTQFSAVDLCVHAAIRISLAGIYACRSVAFAATSGTAAVLARRTVPWDACCRRPTCKAKYMVSPANSGLAYRPANSREEEGGQSRPSLVVLLSSYGQSSIAGQLLILFIWKKQ